MLPRVVVHNEMSLDARLDGLDVDMGRFYALAGTWHEDCTLVGSETILAAMPDIGSVEPADAASGGPAGQQTDEASCAGPLLAVVDSRGRPPGLARLRGQPYWRDVIALCSESTPREHVDRLEADGVECVQAGAPRVDLRRVLEYLADRHQVRVVRVDAGGSLVGVLLREGLVDEVSVAVEPRLVGGESHRWLVRAPDAEPDDVVQLSLREVERFEDGMLWLRYDVADR